MSNSNATWVYGKENKKEKEESKSETISWKSSGYLGTNPRIQDEKKGKCNRRWDLLTNDMRDVDGKRRFVSETNGVRFRVN